MTQKLLTATRNKKVHIVRTDVLYATNENSRYVTELEIKADFDPKDPNCQDYKQQKQLKVFITKEWASRLGR